MIKDNMLSTKGSLNAFAPGALALQLADRARQRRLEMNLSQAALAARSGVSFGTLKRFERSAQISLKNLLMLAVVLGAGEEFDLLFSGRNYASFDEAVNYKKIRERKRGRIKA